MTRDDAFNYVGYCVDDALSPREISAIPKDRTKVRLVGWECGFEPMFVAVWSYLGTLIDDLEAEEIATDYLEEIGWFGPNGATMADHVL